MKLAFLIQHTAAYQKGVYQSENEIFPLIMARAAQAGSWLEDWGPSRSLLGDAFVLDATGQLRTIEIKACVNAHTAGFLPLFTPGGHIDGIHPALQHGVIYIKVGDQWWEFEDGPRLSKAALDYWEQNKSKRKTGQDSSGVINRGVSFGPTLLERAGGRLISKADVQTHADEFETLTKDLDPCELLNRHDWDKSDPARRGDGGQMREQLVRAAKLKHYLKHKLRETAQSKRVA